jgi:hypothetical protein
MFITSLDCFASLAMTQICSPLIFSQPRISSHHNTHPQPFILFATALGYLSLRGGFFATKQSTTDYVLAKNAQLASPPALKLVSLNDFETY